MEEVEVFELIRVIQAISDKPKYIEILTDAMNLEAKKIAEKEAAGGEYLGFEWYEISASPQTLNKMVTDKLLNITLSTRSSTYYRVRNPKLIKKALEDLSSPIVVKAEGIPSDLFHKIIGYENVKSLIKLGIESEEPCNFLLSGNPASSKSLFLMELARLPESYYCLGPTLTSAGLAEILFAAQPKFLLIDEIDRLAPDNVGTLNSLMAFGHISETKYGKTRALKLETRVFAAGIRVEILPKDLLSRFVKLRFPPYGKTEFITVSTGVLEGEGAEPSIATLISTTVWDTLQENADVRQAVQIFRLSSGDSSKAVEVMKILRQYGAFGR